LTLTFQVIFLASGRLAYFGEPTQAVELLKRFGYPCPLNYNPADAIIQVLGLNLRNNLRILLTSSESQRGNAQGGVLPTAHPADLRRMGP